MPRLSATCAPKNRTIAPAAQDEGLGITLLDAIEGDDPTALIGLPLIRTAACCAPRPSCHE